jgi:hypothetical protein
MGKLRHLLLSTTVAAIVSACAAPGPKVNLLPLANSQYSLNGQSTTGLVVMSLTETGAYSGAYIHVDLHSNDKLVDGSIEMHENLIARHLLAEGSTQEPKRGDKIPPDDPVGRLVAFELPAGNYEFYYYRGDRSPDNRLYASKTFFSLKFPVTAGYAVYVGNINFDFPGGNIYRMELLDKRERDLPLFYAKYPGVPRERMTFHRLKVE